MEPVRDLDKLVGMLSDAQRIYADAGILADAAIRGAPDATVRSFSPGVDAEKAYDVIPNGSLALLERTATKLADTMAASIWERNPDLASALARESYDHFHRLLYKAACLEDTDFTDRVVILQPVDPSDGAFNDTFASPLERLLGDRPNVTVIHVDRSLLPVVEDPRPPAPTLRERISFASAEAMLYRLFVKFWSRVDWTGPRGVIYTFRDNELLKEAGYALGVRGFAIKALQAPDVAIGGVEKDEPDPVDISSIAADAAAACRTAFEGMLHPGAVDAMARSFERDVRKDISDYCGEYRAWRRRVAELPVPRAVLTNIVKGTTLAAMHGALSSRGVPLCLFQHGVTMEYHRTHLQYTATHETALSDLALLYNDKAVEVAASSPYAQGEAFSAGLPSDYAASARDRSGMKSAPPVWYIGTALYLGNRGSLFEGVHDGRKSAFETGLVEQVLARLPHKVAYKPYPGRRFLDPLPEEIAVERAANIEAIRQRIDMRYLFRRARILVCARSFSTPSWCIMSGRPVIHIDIPEQSQLTDEARAAFEDGVFLFDAGHPDFYQDLRDFLSQPIEAIERAYEEKAAARARLVKRFICAAQNGAGRRAARRIVEMIERGGPTEMGRA